MCTPCDYVSRYKEKCDEYVHIFAKYFFVNIVFGKRLIYHPYIEMKTEK